MINSAIKINIKYYETIKSRPISHKLGKDILTLKIGRVLESVLTNNKRTSRKSKDKTIEKKARDWKCNFMKKETRMTFKSVKRC